MVTEYQCGRKQGGHDDQDTKGLLMFLFEKKFQKSCGHIFNPAGNMQESLEERMHRDRKIYQSKDVPWRIKYTRMVEQVYSVF